MNLKFGFELEGFHYDEKGVLALPPSRLPMDGYPLLVELRSLAGGASLHDAFCSLAGELLKHGEKDVKFSKSEETINADLVQAIRRRGQVGKNPLVVSNIYNKKPRMRKNNQVLASFQISFSNMIAKERKVGEVFIPSYYGLFDFFPIIKKLDDAFEKEIKKANRQKGMYAVKDNRVEYRSLPNNVINFRSMEELSKLQAKLKEIFDV